MTNTIEKSLNHCIETGLVPGLVAAVGNTDETNYLGAFGSASADSFVEMQSDAIFRIASMTKAVTSVAVMQLVEQGLIDLDVPASEYLPSLADKQLLVGFEADDAMPLFRKPQNQITTRQLLTHTAGFGYEMWSSNLHALVASGHLSSITENSDQYTKAPLVFEPGTQWLYGIATDQLGLMIESITGSRLDQHLSKTIFQPLGMVDTDFTVPEGNLERLVSVSIPNENNSYSALDYPAPDNEGFLSGGGGLVSTASDYLLFTRMLLNGGQLNGSEILRSKTIQEMAVSQIGSLTIDTLISENTILSRDVDFFPGIKKSQGLGFLITEEAIPRGRAAGSLSWAGIFNSYYWIDQISNKTGVILMQVLPFFHDDCIDVYQRFEEAVYS